MQLVSRALWEQQVLQVRKARLVKWVRQGPKVSLDPLDKTERRALLVPLDQSARQGRKANGASKVFRVFKDLLARLVKMVRKALWVRRDRRVQLVQ